MSKEKRIAEIHAKTILKMQNQLVSGNLETIKSYLLGSEKLAPRPLETCDSFQKLSSVLYSKQLIKHGKYGLLKDVFHGIGMDILIDDLTKAEEEIARIELGGDD